MRLEGWKEEQECIPRNNNKIRTSIGFLYSDPKKRHVNKRLHLTMNCKAVNRDKMAAAYEETRRAISGGAN